MNIALTPMVKDIRFSGITADTSDFDCADGELAVAADIASDNGALAAVGSPQRVLHVEEGRVICLHKTSSQTNYIFASDGDNPWLYYYEKLEAETLFDVKLEPNGRYAHRIGRASEFSSVSPMGDMLVFAAAGGLQFARWCPGTGYQWLGARPPLPRIEFSVALSGSLSSSVKNIYVPTEVLQPGEPAAHSADTEKRMSQMRAASEAVYSALFKDVAEKVTSQGLFYQPFFVRYAVRLYDGSYTMHSAPILMQPTLLTPMISVTQADNASDGLSHLTLNLSGTKFFKLQHRVLDDADDTWTGLISSIDIFVSAPIYTFNQSESVSGFGSYSNHIATSNLTGRGRNNAPASTNAPVFIGSYSYGDVPSDHFSDEIDADGNYCLLRTNEHMTEDIRSCANYYLVASIPYNDIKHTTSFFDVPIDSTDFSSLQVRPTLPDEYLSHCDLVPRSMYVYNSRLNLAMSSRSLPAPFSLESMIGSISGSASDAGYDVYVFSRSGGKECCAYAHCDAAFPLAMLSRPSFFYYPDPSAYRMVFCYKTGATDHVAEVSLSEHQHLNGAFFYGAPSTSVSFHTPETTDNLVPCKNKVFTSEVNNPFVFAPANMHTVGSGEVLAITSAVKAISQGQFGQHPLYVFSSEGVWALQTTANGTYSACQPVSRDVCSCPLGIAQTDSAVIFPSSRGIMMLQGGTTSCLSDAIEHIGNLPGAVTPGVGNLVPLAQFLCDCRMIYDYAHQRIVVYNSDPDLDLGYAFAFSLRAKTWSMLRWSLDDNVPAYPEALAMDTDSYLVNISQCDPQAALSSAVGASLLVTRPFKLGYPGVLKTIDSLIIRGMFRRGHVRCVLHGSRDLFNWFPVRSSVDHVLRGFRGTPYKFFRLTLTMALDNAESVSGFTVSFNARFNNQIR